MIYFKRPPSGLRTATAICAPASSPRIWARCSCVRGAYAPPSRSTEGLGDFSDLLAEADPAGAAGAACSALGRLSGLDGYEHGFQCQFECRPPHFVRRVGTASLKPVSSSGLFILALCWLSSVIGGVSFFRRLPPERVRDAAAAARGECGCAPEPVKLEQSGPTSEGARWSCAAA